LVVERPCGQLSYSGDHRKGLRLPATIFVLLVPIQQLFVLLVPIQQLFPFYHHPQSRGITGLLDMKRLLFALSLARRTGHSVNPQPFDWLYLPRSLLLTIAFSKRVLEPQR
jgi:hypothetical protein